MEGLSWYGYLLGRAAFTLEVDVAYVDDDVAIPATSEELESDRELALLAATASMTKLKVRTKNKMESLGVPEPIGR